MIGQFVINNQLRFQGSVMYAMIGLMCGAVMNIGLDPLLMFGFGMGARGAAVATVFAQLVSVVLSVVFLRRQRFSFDFRPSSFRLYGDKAGQILKLGMPYAVQRTLVYSSFTAISGTSP